MLSSLKNCDDESPAIIPILDSYYDPAVEIAYSAEPPDISSNSNDSAVLQPSDAFVVRRCVIFSHLIFDFNNYGESESHDVPIAASNLIEMNQLWAIKSGTLISRWIIIIFGTIKWL